MLHGYLFIIKNKNAIFFSSICLILSLILILFSRTIEGFAQWYAVNVFPFFPNTIGRLFSLWNDSFFEAGILVALILIGLFLLISFCLLIFHHPLRKMFLSSGLKTMLCITSVFILMYTLTCSINYQRDEIGTVFNLPVEDTSTEKLEKLTILLVGDITNLTDDPKWNDSLRTLNDMAYIKMQSINAMKQLGKKEPSLAGYYSKPKPIYFSKLLSKFGIEGIFSPFTMEANYNNEMTSFLVPFTICHEFAHSKGYMKEGDAGFIAYLACKNSPSKIFQYSAAFHALTFTLDALKSEVSNESFNETYQKLPDAVKIQLRYIKVQRQNQSSSSFQSVAKSLNNFYLLANAQPEGAKSYGRIVDLLIADYADQINSENLL